MIHVLCPDTISTIDNICITSMGTSDCLLYCIYGAYNKSFVVR